jgi:hypothetical protein
MRRSPAFARTPGFNAKCLGRVFWLAVDLLRAFPCHAQWRLRSRQAYSSGGCAGMTGFPASPASRFTRPK